MNVEAIPGQGTTEYGGQNPQRALLQDLLYRHRTFREQLPGVAVDLIYGNSYGLYAAAVAAGAIDEEEAYNLADSRMSIVRETESKSVHGPSEMWALVGAGREAAEKFAQQVGACLSNDNGPLIQVIAGYSSLRDRVVQLAAEYGVRKVVPLSTGGAFHSPIRREDSERYAGVVENARIRDPKIPMVSSTDPRIIRTEGDLRRELVTQMVAPVEHPRVVGLFEELGVTNVFEIGPGATLKRSFQSLSNKLEVFSLETELAKLRQRFAPQTVSFQA